MARVADLLRAKMRFRGLSALQIDLARALWTDFASARRPRVTKPAVYAAAVEHTLARLGLIASETIAATARRYGVGASSVLRVCREMERLLDMDRYLEISLLQEPPAGLVQTDEGIILPRSALEEPGELPGLHGPLVLETEEVMRLCQLPATDEVWSGARRTLQTYVTGENPFRPDIALWLHEPTQLILGQRVLFPEDGDQLVLDSFLQTLASPAVGQGRRPHTVQMDDERLVDRLAAHLSLLGIRMRHLPTTGIDRVISFMKDSLLGAGKESQSYVVPGRIAPGDLAPFFHATARLLHACPWQVARPGQAIQVEIFRWGFDSPCAVIGGTTFAGRGLAIFRSPGDCLAALHAAGGKGDVVLHGGSPGVERLTLTYCRGTDLHPGQRKEVLKHGWEVADAASYPLLAHEDADGVPVPLFVDSYRVAGACADALAKLVQQQHQLFAPGRAAASLQVALDDWPDGTTVRVIGPLAEW